MATADEVAQARDIARQLLAVCPMRNVPLDLMWRVRDDPDLAWIWPSRP
jgi:hypothetical protein